MDTALLLQPLQNHKCAITSTGLKFADDITFDEWEAIGDTLARLDRAVQWLIGDWLNYGEAHYRETYAQALDDTKYSYQTLANMASVASKVESSRRRENLTWTHHCEVASLPPDVQDGLLEWAEETKASTRELRSAVRVYKGYEHERVNGHQSSAAPLSIEAQHNLKLSRWLPYCIDVFDEHNHFAMGSAGRSVSDIVAICGAVEAYTLADVRDEEPDDSLRAACYDARITYTHIPELALSREDAPPPAELLDIIERYLTLQTSEGYPMDRVVFLGEPVLSEHCIRGIIADVLTTAPGYGFAVFEHL